MNNSTGKIILALGVDRWGELVCYDENDGSIDAVSGLICVERDAQFIPKTPEKWELTLIEVCQLKFWTDNGEGYYHTPTDAN